MKPDSAKSQYPIVAEKFVPLTLPDIEKQRGVALLTVMFIMALMMTLAAFMVEEQHLTIRRAQNSLQSEYAYQTALAGEQLALAVLRDDLAEDIREVGSKPINDHQKEDWVEFEKPTLPIDFELSPIQGDGKSDQALTIKIIDESAKFNLNNLFEPVDPQKTPADAWSIDWHHGFRGLLEALKLDPGLSRAVMEWLDPNDSIKVPSEFAAEDNDYLLQDPPYRTANRLMNDVSELALLEGFDEEVIEKLKPYVTVLPSYGAKINANNCEPELFQMLYSGAGGVANYYSQGDADTLITHLERDDADGIPEFPTKVKDLVSGKSSSGLPQLRPNEAGFLGERSVYFRIISTVKVGDISYGVESLVKRINLNELQAYGIVPTDELTKLRDIAQANGSNGAYIKVIQRRRTIS